jgi:hypothetical protein
MNWKTDPPRLRDLPDEMPDDLASALDELGGAAPTAHQIGALRTNVRLALGLPLAGGPSHPAPPASPIAAHAAAVKGTLTAGQWLSWIVAPLGAGAIAGAVLLGTTRTPEPRTVPAPISAPSVDVRVSAPKDSIEVPSLGPADLGTESGRATAVNDDRAPIAKSPRPAAPPAAAPAEEIAPRVELVPEPGAAGYPATSPPVQSETEVSLLSRAQEALERDPSRALDLVHDHEQRFDTGLLVQEREVIAIEALVRLGRKKEAETRAAAFHARFPRSAHGRRVDVLLHAGSN